MIPALVVGGLIGYAVGKSSSDKKESVHTEIVDESEVPDWIKKEFEKESTDNKNNTQD